jgi:hypothetical protein
MAGDVITAVDGTQINDSRALARHIAPMAPGTSVKLGIMHNGNEKTVSLTLGQLPDERQAQTGNAEHGTAESDTPHSPILCPIQSADVVVDRGAGEGLHAQVQHPAATANFRKSRGTWPLALSVDRFVS